jgi:hypothetical protein
MMKNKNFDCTKNNILIIVHMYLHTCRPKYKFKREETLIVFISACCLLVYVLDLCFNLEDGDSTFILNVGKLLLDYMASHPRR